MKIFTVYFPVQDDGTDEGGLYKGDAIVYDNQFWLVAEWIDNPLSGGQRPARLIRLDGLTGPPDHGEHAGHLVAANPIPKSVLEGRALPGQGEPFAVIENPNLPDDIPDEKKH